MCFLQITVNWSTWIVSSPSRSVKLWRQSIRANLFFQTAVFWRTSSWMNYPTLLVVEHFYATTVILIVAGWLHEIIDLLCEVPQLQHLSVTFRFVNHSTLAKQYQFLLNNILNYSRFFFLNLLLLNEILINNSTKKKFSLKFITYVIPVYCENFTCHKVVRSSYNSASEAITFLSEKHRNSYCLELH